MKKKLKIQTETHTSYMLYMQLYRINILKMVASATAMTKKKNIPLGMQQANIKMSKFSAHKTLFLRVAKCEPCCR